MLSVCLVENDLNIGNVYDAGINMINRSCETHILVGNRKFWGKGHAIETYKILMEYLFCECGMNRSQVVVFKNNIGFVKVHEKMWI